MSMFRYSKSMIHFSGCMYRGIPLEFKLNCFWHCGLDLWTLILNYILDLNNLPLQLHDKIHAAMGIQFDISKTTNFKIIILEGTQCLACTESYYGWYYYIRPLYLSYYKFNCKFFLINSIAESSGTESKEKEEMERTQNGQGEGLILIPPTF